MRFKVGGSTLELVEGDITGQDTDAIVNAANSGLRGGGGVDGAIHRAGGPEIMAECRRIGGCPTGSAVITGAGRLKCRKVIHAVGPVYAGGGLGEEEKLAGAYRASLALATEHGLASVAFPSISTGAYGYPIQAAAHVALRTVTAYMKEHAQPGLVRFVLFGREAYETYAGAARELLGPESGA